MSKIKVLDCTLRDGGYVNNWDFGAQNIKTIIQGLTTANIDIIECGFLSEQKFLGSESSIFNNFHDIDQVIPNDKQNSKYVAMINYGEFEITNIPDKSQTKIDGLRIVFHKHEREAAIEYCRELSQKGYMLFMQPMLTLNYKEDELITLVEQVNTIEPYAFYIVDSFGNVRKNDVLRMFYTIDHHLAKAINLGYHPHNNLQLAYGNSQAIVELYTERTRIIDASVFGMGRGAGNLNTELFIEYLNTRTPKYQVEPLLKLMDDILNNIYSEYYWGYSLPHYLSATHNCHPNYASYLSEKNTLDFKQIGQILSLISENKKVKYDVTYVEELYLNYQNHYVDDTQTLDELTKQFKNNKLLLVAPGKTIQTENHQVQAIVKQVNPITMSINFIPANLGIDYLFISNQKRFNQLLDNGILEQLENVKVIITSNVKVSNIITKQVSIINYSSLLNTSTSVGDNALLMLVKLLKKCQSDQILLAGFDGYSIENQENYVDQHLTLSNNKKHVAELNVGIKTELSHLNTGCQIKFVTTSKYN